MVERGDKASPLFVLHGNGPHLNRGCEAIALSTSRLLGEAFGGCRVVHAPSVAAADRRRHPDRVGGDLVVPWVLHYKFTPGWYVHFPLRRLGLEKEPLHRLLPGASAVLECGGDNLTFDYGVPKRFFEAAQAVRRAGKPFVLWGASVGPFDSQPEFEKWAAGRLREMTLICARETLTQQYLASIGVSQNVVLVADPAFALEPEAVDLEAEGLSRLREPCVGLNLSPLMGRYAGGLAAWTERAAACVEALVRSLDMPVVLVPHVFTSGANDQLFLAGLCGRLGGLADRVVLLKREYSSRQLKYIVSHLAAFAGGRMHATIASLSSGVPTLSLSYSVKSRGINRDIFGHQEWVLGVQEMTPERLARDVRRLLERSAAVRRVLGEVAPRMAGLALEAAGHVARCMGRPGGGG